MTLCLPSCERASAYFYWGLLRTVTPIYYYVSDLYDFSRETRRMWLDNGKPRQGMLHQMFVQSKRRFKCALKYITKNENALRKRVPGQKIV